jgi:cysteinyl-tRNA synthetase
MPAPFRLYNTLSRRVEDFTPLKPGHIGLYVCGMTVYDLCHAGHARAMVTFDTFVRYLRHRGWSVKFVRNFTDVDDKIIRRAAEEGVEPLALAQQQIDYFHADVRALGLKDPDEEPRVSTSIGDIIAMIERLVERGHAYPSEGNVWYDVRSFDGYGSLSGQKVDELRNPDVGDGKRSSSDFALWKAVKPGEPAWDSPWGPGRPGWHIECSAMASTCLGDTFDIHGGGLDLVFPHHENEIAQSEGASGCTYARWWMHNGLLTMPGGRKMGKSEGNAFSIRDLLALFPAEAVRLYYLQNHYRSPLPWDQEALPSALAMLCRLYEAREVAESMGGQERADDVANSLGEDAQTVLELSRSFEAQFHGALDDDFNTSRALSYAFELARAVNRFSNHKKARKRGGPVVAGALECFKLMANALGILGDDVSAFMEEVKNKRLGAMGISRADIEGLLEQRLAARQSKDWSRADAIRDELEAKNIVVMDTATGVDWRVRITST